MKMKETSKEQTPPSSPSSQTPPSSSPRPSSSSSDALVKLFWSLLSIVILLITLLILIEVPFGTISQVAVRSIIDADGNSRYMCSNCTYLVNRLDLIAQRKGMKLKHFDAQIRAVCPAPGSRAFSEAHQPTPEQAAAHTPPPGPGGPRAATTYVEPMLIVSPRQGFCRDLFVYYREQLRLRFRTLIRNRNVQINKEPVASSSLLSHNRILSAPDFCRDHCLQGNEIGGLFERLVLEFVDYVQLSAPRAGAVSFLRHWGRLIYFASVVASFMGLLMWWRRAATMSMRQRQLTEQKRAQLHAESAIVSGALEAEPWTRLIYCDGAGAKSKKKPIGGP